MLIRAVRLLNIKSFGAGPEGTGTRLAFDRGLNRIAGGNGAGKSTVIEALGYALFDSAPELGARMDLETALLRQGAAEGQIEVELETADGLCRVRRGVGKKSRIPWTITDASGFVTHETEPEVRRFLAAAAGLPGPEGLGDVFRKLVGVRQGRLLDPFELPPAEARRHFAPILNVEVYQRCFTDLLAPAQRLREEGLQIEGKIKAARAQVELLAGAAEQAAALEQRLAAGREQLGERRLALTQARELRDRWEARARAIPEANTALALARKEVENSETRLRERKEHLQRAEQARGVLDAHAAAHAAYLQAENDLAECAALRPEFEAQRERLAELRQEHARADARAQENEAQARTLLEKLQPLIAELAGRLAALEKREQAFAAAAGAAPPDSIGTGAAEAELQKTLAVFERWTSALLAATESARRDGELAATANAALTTYDPARALKANAERDAARQALERARTCLTELEARRRSRREMGHDLETTRQCPLLNERCRQFDPGKLVLSEVKLDEALDQAKRAHAGAETVFRQAEQAAQAAEAEEKGTLDTRARADVALTRIGEHLAVSRDSAGRAAFAQLAGAFAPAGGPPLQLPEAPVLPDPAAQPWEALAAAPEAAQTFCAFAENLAGLAARWRTQWETRRDAAAQRRQRRELEQQQLENDAAGLAEHQTELEARKKEHQELLKVAADAREQVAKLAKDSAALAGKQAEFEAFKAREVQAQQARAAATDGHQHYLAAEAEAGRLEETRAGLALATGHLDRARHDAEHARRALEAAQAAYDSEAHAKARTALEDSAQRVSVLETELKRDEAQLEESRRRAAQLKAAEEEWRTQSARLALVTARSELLEHLRRTLRDAGPRVAEHLVLAVNLRAQSIYAALSPHDPGRLNWQADYELRVETSSGVRRFATLSGGQKVKAALALQLALVQQFSQAGLCVFDEPTYALDAESRERLAEAIVEAQKVSRFEQLFIVSHDDAFDDLVEHTVRLAYSPASGTRLE